MPVSTLPGPQPSTIVATLGTAEHTLPFGSLLLEIVPSEEDGHKVVAALLNDRTVSLNTALVADSRVVPVTTATWEGSRIRRDSVALLALEAASQLSGTSGVRMGPSVGFGQRIVPGDWCNSIDEFGVHLEAQMRELIQSSRPLKEEIWPIDLAREYFTREYFARDKLTDALDLLATWRSSVVGVVTYGNFYALRMGPLVHDAHMLQDFHLRVDGGVLLLSHQSRNGEAVSRSDLPALALSEVGRSLPLRRSIRQHPESEHPSLLEQTREPVALEEQAWLQTIGATSVGRLNKACILGSVPDLIQVCEGFQEKHIAQIADDICEKQDEVGLVCIAGPSSSGKTTFIRRLSVQLKVNGVTPAALGLDDYYLSRPETPRDEAGDYDFEAMEAFQLDALRDHVSRLLAHETVRVPHFDFKRGISYREEGRELRLKPRGVLVLEGIHGLNPSLLAGIPAAGIYRIFVCPLMQLAFDRASRVHASDVRLIRRIVRCRHARGDRAEATILRWPKVRNAERSHIYPYQCHADVVFDSSLVYELCVLRVYAERYLLEVPRRSPAGATASRLMRLLDNFVSIYPDQVPPTSLLREFIGGSGFEY